MITESSEREGPGRGGVGGRSHCVTDRLALTLARARVFAGGKANRTCDTWGVVPFTKEGGWEGGW